MHVLVVAARKMMMELSNMKREHLKTGWLRGQMGSARGDDRGLSFVKGHVLLMPSVVTIQRRKWSLIFPCESYLLCYLRFLSSNIAFNPLFGSRGIFQMNHLIVYPDTSELPFRLASVKSLLKLPAISYSGGL